MKLPEKVNSNTSRANLRVGLVAQQRLEERESWHKLVLKVIIWSEQSVDKSFSKTASLITRSEWNNYRQRVIKINVTKSKEKVLSNLKETFQKIKTNGGFKDL